jgi:predicted transcriptional regulator
MNREEIEIQIGSDGRVQYTIKGVKGNACESISELLERLGQVEREEKTSEYYDQQDDAHISVSGD